jgi:hypothetical protein
LKSITSVVYLAKKLLFEVLEINHSSQYNTGSETTDERIKALITIEEECRLGKTSNICS